MFDWYEPDPPLACPACNQPVLEWQGYGGPNGLFVWHQGDRSPVDQRVDADVRLADDELGEFTLPGSFVIHGHCAADCGCTAHCQCNEGCWTETIIDDTADLVRFWIDFDVSGLGPPPGAVTVDGGTFAHRFCGAGVGVTAYDNADARKLVTSILGGEPLPPVVREKAHVDVDALHLNPKQVGVPVWRGIWFPAVIHYGPDMGPR